MKMKWLRTGSLVVLLGLIAAIPASTQVLFGAVDGDAEAGNLPLLILVNRMELTPEQMQEIRGLLQGLLEEREAVELRRAELEEDMIAFTGTVEELDEILDAFRAESVEQAETAREHVAEVIDRIKGILTLKQGEILAEALPGLLGDQAESVVPQSYGRGVILGQGAACVGGFCVLLGQPGGDSDVGLRERLSERLEERFADNPEILERLQQRLGGHEQLMERRLGGRGCSDLGFQQRPCGVNVLMHVRRGGLQHRGLDRIEQLVEVLELKLEAIE